MHLCKRSGFFSYFEFLQPTPPNDLWWSMRLHGICIFCTKLLCIFPWAPTCLIEKPFVSLFAVCKMSGVLIPVARSCYVMASHPPSPPQGREMCGQPWAVASLYHEFSTCAYDFVPLDFWENQIRIYLFSMLCNYIQKFIHQFSILVISIILHSLSKFLRIYINYKSNNEENIRGPSHLLPTSLIGFP